MVVVAPARLTVPAVASRGLSELLGRTRAAAVRAMHLPEQLAAERDASTARRRVLNVNKLELAPNA